MTQQEIKFERFGRGEQLAALDALQLPSYGGVSGATLKAVLRSIESHARGEGQSWATQETIRRKCNLKNVRTVKRAVDALEELNLITTERRAVGFARYVNHHTIVWQQVVDYLHREPQNVPYEGDKLSPSLVTFSADQGDKKSPSLVTNCHLQEKRNLKRNEPPPPNGARAEEEAAEEIFSERKPRMPTKRKQPEPRPILEADYAAAPTQHRTSAPPVDTGPSSRPNVYDLEEQAYFERRRGLPGWSGFDQDRVRDMFAAAGVAMAHDLMRLAIARGITPADCDAIVEQFHGSVEAKTLKPLGAGALVKRIEQGNWPCLLTSKADLDKPAGSAAPDLATERKHAAQRARFEAEEQAAAQDALRRQEREQRLGQQLDALPEAELLALQERLPGWCRQFFAGDLRARPVRGVLARQECFNLLESEATDGR